MKVPGMLAVSASIAITGVAFAEGDIGLQLVSNQIVTTKISEEGQSLGPSRVFSGLLTNISGTWYTDEPGIQVKDGTLAPSTDLRFYFTKALRQWNGSDFESVSAGRLSATFGPPSNSIITPLSDGNSANLILPVDEEGGLHAHPDWVLENFDPAANPYFFLVEARFSSSQPGLTDSDPFYIVFGVNADESELESMEDYVRDHVVPAPGSATFLIGLSVFARRRR